MPVCRIVLFTLKPGIAPDQTATWAAMGRSMVGKIPGLISWDAGTPLTATAARANGYDMGVVLVLRNEAQLKSFAEHPAHHEVHRMRQTLCEDTLVFDFGF